MNKKRLLTAAILTASMLVCPVAKADDGYDLNNSTIVLEADKYITNTINLGSNRKTTIRNQGTSSISTGTYTLTAHASGAAGRNVVVENSTANSNFTFTGNLIGKAISEGNADARALRMGASNSENVFSGSINIETSAANKDSLGIQAWNGAKTTFSGDLTDVSSVGTGTAGYARAIQVYDASGAQVILSADQTKLNSEGGGSAEGIYTHRGKVYLNGNADITAKNGVTYTRGIGVQSDNTSADAQYNAGVYLNGNEINVTSTTENNEALGLFSSGSYSTIESNSATLNVIANSTNGYAMGLVSQYGANINLAEGTNTTIDVNAGTYARGIVSQNGWGYPGHFTSHGNLTANATGVSSAYGVYVYKDSSFTADQLTVSGSASGEDAWGVGAMIVDSIDVSIGSLGKTSSLKGTSENGYGFGLFMQESSGTTSAALKGTMTVEGSTAGIYVNSGTLVNEGDLTVKGGMYNAGTFTNNGSLTSSGNTDSAIYNEGTIISGADSKYTFDSNSAAGGGAIFNTAAGHIEISDNVIFKDNTATYEGGGGSDIKNYGYVKIGDGAQFIRSEYQDPIVDDKYDVSIFTMNGSETVIGDNAVFKNIGQVLNNEGNTTHTIGDGAIFEHNGSVITNFGGSYTIGDNAIFKDSQFMTIANKGNGSSVTIGKNALFEGNMNPVYHLPSEDWVYMNGNGAVANNNSTNSTMTFGDGFVAKKNLSSGKGIVYNVASSTINFNGSAKFENNISEDGVIYNAGIVNFNGASIFSGNKDNENNLVNAIYNKGTINFIGNEDSILEGGIDGVTNGSTTGLVNITGKGVVEVLGNLTNQTVNVTSGELVLSNGTESGSNISGSTISVSGDASIHTLDGVINDYQTGTSGGVIELATSGTTVKADFNMTSGAIDKYVSAGGTLSVDILPDLIGDLVSTTGTDVQFTQAGVVVDTNSAFYKGGTKVSITGTGTNDGKVRLVTNTGFTLNDAVEETTSAKKEAVVYDLSSGETFAATDDPADRTIAKADFVIQGEEDASGKISTLKAAEGAKGIIVDGSSTLTVSDTEIKNFKTNSAIDNSGTLNLENVVIGEDNTYGITNSGVTNVYDGSSVDMIGNTGTVNIANGAKVKFVQNKGTVQLKIIDYVDQAQSVETFITNTTGSGDGNTTVDLQLSDHSAPVSDGVTWNIAAEGMTQNSVRFTGDGHLTLVGGKIIGAVICDMTGNTLVVKNAIDGNFTVNTSSAHAILAENSSVSGIIKNDGLLEITASNFDIENGVTQSTTSDGTLNIGDGVNSTVVSLLSGGTPNSISQNKLNILDKATLNANIDKLLITSGITNEGLLNIIDGTAITRDIIGNGITAINSNISWDAENIDIENNVNLVSGTLTAYNATNGDVIFTGVIANGGTLNVQDNKTGSIYLGQLDLSNEDLFVNMDADLSLSSGPADVISATSVLGDNSITIKSINAIAYTSALDYDVNIANSIAKDHINFAATKITGTGTDNLMLSYNSANGNITGSIASLASAITSSTETKMYSLGTSEDISAATDLTLGGESLSITADNTTIYGGAKSITLANADQSLVVSGDTHVAGITGFTETAIDNTAGGTVGLNNVNMVGNGTDVKNSGSLILSGVNSFVSIVNNENGNIIISDNSDIVDLTNSGTVSGQGTINLTGNSTNSGTISGNITNSGILNTSGTISGNIDNDDTSGGYINITGGTISGDIYSSGTGSGSVKVNGDAALTGTITDQTIDVYSGNTLTTSASSIDDAGNVIALSNGSGLNLSNGLVETISNALVYVGSGEIANLKIDLNATNGTTDKFENGISGLGQVSITDVNITGSIPASAYNGTTIDLTQTTGLTANQIVDSKIPGTVTTPIRYLQGSITDSLLTYAPTGSGYESYNPAVMASPIAAQLGGYLTQLNSYDEAFRNMDMYMLMPQEQRQALKFKNKYAASNSGLLYDSTITRQESAEGWFRPYATFEKVGLRNGPTVENIAYGSFMGGESPMYDLGHGWDGMWGAYVGYNGSHQNYDGVGIYQNGGTFGLTGMAYKGNFFTGLTINAGANAGEANTMYGHDNFAMLMAGVASKTGYNWELAKGKFIIQPSWLMSYSFVNTFDYTNAAGVRINSDPLHAIQLQPELKFIGNLKHGWQPYASVAMIWNIMDKTKFKANDVSMPGMSVKPYVKYGVGVRKTWGERFTGFFQTYLTNGGRNGVGLQAGFTWTFGGGENKKSHEQKIQKSMNKTPELKKTEIVLNDQKVQ